MNLTLNDIERMAKHPKYKSAIIEYMNDVLGEQQSYVQFVDRVDSEIDWAVRELENDRPLYLGLKEDQITKMICSLLKGRGLTVTHGEYCSGETDMRITHGCHEWIGEAKWFRQISNPIEGMKQLSTRYSSGCDFSDRGCVLIYNGTKNLSEKISALKNYYMSNSHEFVGMTVEACSKSKQAFVTHHKHDSSGELYTVRHRFINLHFEPKDKSAMSRRKA